METQTLEFAADPIPEIPHSAPRSGNPGRRWGRLALRRVVALPVVHQALCGMARVGWLPPGIWRRLPVDREFQVVAPNGVRFRYRATPNDSIGRALYWRGLRSWEPETLAIFAQLALQARTFIDVGANTGVFTLLACAANPQLRAVAFEPVPRIRQQLGRNIERNGFQNRCHIRSDAVCDRVGQTQLHVPFGELPSSASLHPAGFRGYRGELIEVPTTTLDAICDFEPGVDLVKIDVEGFEDKVLLGMTRLLTQSPPILIVECNPDGPFREVERILGIHGYRFLHLRAEGPVPVAAIEPDPRQECRNYLCLPPSSSAAPRDQGRIPRGGLG